MGAIFAMGLNVIGAFVILALGMATGGKPLYLLGGIGIVQLAWLVPLALRFRRMGQMETVKGVVIAGAITFMLNAACWGLFYGLR